MERNGRQGKRKQEQRGGKKPQIIKSRRKRKQKRKREVWIGKRWRERWNERTSVMIRYSEWREIEKESVHSYVRPHKVCPAGERLKGRYLGTREGTGAVEK